MKTLGDQVVRFGAININGMRGKAEHVEAIIRDNRLAFAFICETRQREANRNHPLTVVTALGKHSGPNKRRPEYGACILRHPDVGMHEFEILEVAEYGHRLAIRFRGAIFVGVYIPPKGGNMATPDEETFAAISGIQASRRSNEPIYLMGDFNARMGETTGDTSWNDRGRLMASWMKETELEHPTPSGESYTFRARGGQSKVDYVLHGRAGNSSLTYHQDPHAASSDHALLIGTARYTSGQARVAPEAYISWNIRKLDDPKVGETMANNYATNHRARAMETVSQDIRTPEDVNRCYAEICKGVTDNADETLGRRRRYVVPPSMSTPEVRRLRKVEAELSRMWDLHRRTNDLLGEEAYRAMMLVRQDIARLQREFEATRAQEYFDAVDKLPAHLQSKTLRGSRICRLRARGCILNADTDSMVAHADKVKKAFSLVAGATLHTAPAVSWEATPYTEWVTVDDVRTTLQNLTRGKAPGISGIRNDILKPIADHIAEPLAILFNKMIAIGIVPDEWREARIVPIPKVERSKDIKDHRPISLTEVIRKVFERSILPTLVRYVEPLDIAQGGFRSERGTQEQIAGLNDAIVDFIRRHGRLPVVIFGDIKAAYDSVDLALLWTKLAQTGLPPAMQRIVRSLFTSIHSHIAIAGKESPRFEHTAGVLQGSILSPMLYSVYINDLAATLRGIRDCPTTTFLYADDIAILADDDMQATALLAAAERHSLANNYRFNPAKCEVMNASTTLRIYNADLPTTTQFQYLGVTFGPRGIDWRAHIERMKAKTMRLLGFYSSIGFHAGGYRERSRIQLYKTFLRPVFEYGMAVMPAVKTYANSLDSIQQECLSALFSVGKKTSRAAMNVLCALPDMHHRHLELNARWQARLARRDNAHLAVRLMEHIPTSLKTRSCFRMANPVFDKWKADPSRGMDDVILTCRLEWLETARQLSRSLRLIPTDPQCKPRLMYQLSRETRHTARLCYMWLLNRTVGNTMRCPLCDKLGVQSHAYTCHVQTPGPQIDLLLSTRQYGRAAALLHEWRTNLRHPRQHASPPSSNDP